MRTMDSASNLNVSAVYSLISWQLLVCLLFKGYQVRVKEKWILFLKTLPVQHNSSGSFPVGTDISLTWSSWCISFWRHGRCVLHALWVLTAPPLFVPIRHFIFIPQLNLMMSIRSNDIYRITIPRPFRHEEPISDNVPGLYKHKNKWLMNSSDR